MHKVTRMPGSIIPALSSLSFRPHANFYEQIQFLLNPSNNSVIPLDSHFYFFLLTIL